MEKIKNLKNSTILFIPETGIYPYLRGLAVLGSAIKKQGKEVYITHCTGQMFRCPMMPMYKKKIDIPQSEKDDLCKKCNKCFENAQNTYQFSSIELSDFVDEQSINGIDNLVNGAGENLQELKYKGFPVGKMAEYDFILETKFPYYPKLSELHRLLYLQYIKNTALAIALSSNICAFYKPSLLLTFNEYAQGQAVRYSASNFGTSRLALTYPVHFNIDPSRFQIWKSTYTFWISQHCQNWNNIKNCSILFKDVIACWEDSIFRMYSSGTHIFSSRKKNDLVSIFEKLKLDPNKKTIVVYPSSQDERVGIEAAMKIWSEDNHAVDVFLNQIEWLAFLRDYVNKRSDIQVVVRIHPREGSRQFGFDSEHLKQLRINFSENTLNFKIIWPDDPISSYDLMELADVCLVAWSLMGQEAARLGIPVLACTSNMFYPDDDFIQTAKNPEEYKRKLDSIIKMDFTWQHLVKAVRFYHWRIFVTSLNLGETVPTDVQDNTVWPEAPESMVGVINDILNGKQDLIEYNIKKWQESLPDDALEQESEAMRRGIRCLLDKIFYPPVSFEQTFGILYRVYRKSRKIVLHLLGKKVFKKQDANYSFVDYKLEFSENIFDLEQFRQKTKKNKNLRILIKDESNAILLLKGKILKKMSPMVIRLARLHDGSLKYREKNQ